jgi:RNA polymerase sigma-70 factor (ECF subfamily)
MAFRAPAVSPSASLEDPGILPRALLGEAGAFAELLRYHRPAVVSYAARLLNGDGDAAEDIAQEVFTRIWSGEVHWRPGGSSRGYLYGIARFLVLNQRRTNAIHSRLGPEIRDDLSSALRPATPLEELESREDVLRKLCALERVPLRLQGVFVLSRLCGLSHREIAERLGLSPQTVANRLSQALARLRPEA